MKLLFEAHLHNATWHIQSKLWVLKFASRHNNLKKTCVELICYITSKRLKNHRPLIMHPDKNSTSFFSFYDGDDLVQGTKTSDVENFQHHLTIQNDTRIDTSNSTFGDVVSDFNYFPSTVDSNAIDRRNLALQQCDALFKKLVEDYFIYIKAQLFSTNSV